MSEYKVTHNIKYFPVRRFSALTQFFPPIEYLHFLGRRERWQEIVLTLQPHSILISKARDSFPP